MLLLYWVPILQSLLKLVDFLAAKLIELKRYLVICYEFLEIILLTIVVRASNRCLHIYGSRDGPPFLSFSKLDLPLTAFDVLATDTCVLFKRFKVCF